MTQQQIEKNLAQKQLVEELNGVKKEQIKKKS